MASATGPTPKTELAPDGAADGVNAIAYFFKAVIKHDHVISAYQYIAAGIPFLNIQIPWMVQRSDAIDLEMSERMAKPGGHSTAGMANAAYEAGERWRSEMRDSYDALKAHCNDRQKKALDVAKKTWEKFDRAEGAFVAALRETVNGSMYRFLGASIAKEMVRLRAHALRNFLDEWVGIESDEQSGTQTVDSVDAGDASEMHPGSSESACESRE